MVASLEDANANHTPLLEKDTTSYPLWKIEFAIPVYQQMDIYTYGAIALNQFAYQIMMHKTKQASYNFQVRDEHSNDWINWSIESPDTLKERNGICAARLFGHLLREHTIIFCMPKDFDPMDKFGVICPDYYKNQEKELIADETEEGYETVNEGPFPNDIGEGSAHPGKSDTMDDMNWMLQTKNTEFQDTQSESSGVGGEEKQEPSLDENSENNKEKDNKDSKRDEKAKGKKPPAHV